MSSSILSFVLSICAVISAKYDGDPTAPFVRFEQEIDSLIVIYNMKHPFLKKFTEALTDIGVKLGKNSEETLNVPENQTLRTLLDILFVSYGLANISFSNLSKQQFNKVFQMNGYKYSVLFAGQ